MRIILGMIALGFGLSACERPVAIKPALQCTVFDRDPVNSGRLINVRTCYQWEIGCPKPMVLDEKIDGELFCRLPPISERAKS